MDTQELEDDDSDLSGDEDSPEKTPSTQELDRTPADRNAFLFQHNLRASGPELDQLRPLPSQIPFLLDVYSENVHLVVQVVHLPTLQKMMRDHNSSGAPLTPANEALMFAIYYAAVTSMEEDDVNKPLPSLLFPHRTPSITACNRKESCRCSPAHTYLARYLGYEEFRHDQVQPQPPVSPGIRASSSPRPTS